MTKAAQQLHISQPALSIGLKKLEEDQLKKQIALKMLSYCNYFIRAYSKDTESEN